MKFVFNCDILSKGLDLTTSISRFRIVPAAAFLGLINFFPFSVFSFLHCSLCSHLRFYFGCAEVLLFHSLFLSSHTLFSFSHPLSPSLTLALYFALNRTLMFTILNSLSHHHSLTHSLSQSQSLLVGVVNKEMIQ